MLKDLSDEQLLAIYNNHNAVLLQRWEASAHPKFQKMPFPPPNPEFLKLVDEVKSEIEKRKSDATKI